MSERVDKFCHSLQTNLNDLEAHMTSLKTKVQSAPKQAEEAVHKQLDQLQRKVESQKQAVAKAKTSVQNWIDQKTAEAKGTINDWKAKRETKKLVHRADRAEEYAAAAIWLPLRPWTRRSKPFWKQSPLGAMPTLLRNESGSLNVR